MKKSSINYRNLTILTAVLFLSIGFAYLTSNLEIHGIGHLKKTTWDVYFDNVDIVSGEKLASVAPKTNGLKRVKDKELNYSINFETPGDVFEFNVDVVNSGTVDAVVSFISNSTLSDEEGEFATYSISYKDGSPILENNFLSRFTRDTLTIKIVYRNDIEEEDLLQDEKTVNFNLQLTYKQADDDSEVDRTGTSILVKDLSDSGNDAVIYGAKINDDGSISTDGKDDYIDCGFTNYDFGDKVSLVVRFKYFSNKGSVHVFGNWETSGGGIGVVEGYPKGNFAVSPSSAYAEYPSNEPLSTDEWHTAVVTYGSNKVKFYIDGRAVPLHGTTDTYFVEGTGSVKKSPGPMLIGANTLSTASANIAAAPARIDVKATLIYKRKLPEDEVRTNFSGEINDVNKEGLIQYLNFSN